MKSANFGKDCHAHDGAPISEVCMKNDCNKYLQPACITGTIEHAHAPNYIVPVRKIVIDVANLAIEGGVQQLQQG